MLIVAPDSGKLRSNEVTPTQDEAGICCQECLMSTAKGSVSRRRRGPSGAHRRNQSFHPRKDSASRTSLTPNLSSHPCYTLIVAPDNGKLQRNEVTPTQDEGDICCQECLMSTAEGSVSLRRSGPSGERAIQRRNQSFHPRKASAARTR
ncbi:hypothetical protein CDAR_563191 [Caerostris darwini]|uniref:Uncharacterized protein n=1 Tax=Caerostris darwini TaxID=1538125 RepID=A0AAV4UV99_9ARAC|nr:hypothetical protein CDAR_563191 [Caerostris darwini]